MNDKLEQLLFEYLRRFGDGFPTFQLMAGRTEEETIAIVEECLEKGKDVYQLGYCTLDFEVKY